MGTVFLHGNGGSGGSGGGLGLQIVGNPRPKNPVEGTVWANTDVDITGYFLSAEQPENLSEGNLWIKISDSSSIKVGTPLGKDYITVMLDNVSQYINGALVKVEATSFQNGIWVNWILYILKKDDLFDGWSKWGTLNIVNESKGIRITRSSTAFGMCVYDSPVLIDGYKNVYLRYSEASTPSGSAGTLQFRANDVAFTTDTSKASVKATSGVASGILQLPLDEGLQDYKELYFALTIAGGAGGATALVEEIWFE